MTLITTSKTNKSLTNLSSAYLTSQISILSRFINTEGIGSYIADESFTEEYKKRVQRYEEELNVRGMI